MKLLEIILARHSAAYQPGESLDGRVVWRSTRTLAPPIVRLFWRTTGKGTVDTGIVASLALDDPRQDDEHPFSFTLPTHPCSFSGRLISLAWGVEVVLARGKIAASTGFVLAPGGREIRLPAVYAPVAKARSNRLEEDWALKSSS